MYSNFVINSFTTGSPVFAEQYPQELWPQRQQVEAQDELRHVVHVRVGVLEGPHCLEPVEIDEWLEADHHELERDQFDEPEEELRILDQEINKDAIQSALDKP